LFAARPSPSEYFLSDRLLFKEHYCTLELHTEEARAVFASGPKCWGKQKHYAKYRPASAIPTTLFARGSVVINATPRQLYLWERPNTVGIGGWVGPRTGLDVCG